MGMLEISEVVLGCAKYSHSGARTFRQIQSMRMTKSEQQVIGFIRDTGSSIWGKQV